MRFEAFSPAWGALWFTLMCAFTMHGEREAASALCELALPCERAPPPPPARDEALKATPPETSRHCSRYVPTFPA